MTPHHRSYTPQALAVFCAGLLLAASPVFAADRDEHEHKKLAAYFEEWSIYSAGSTSRTYKTAAPHRN
jgi:hypothetical protein